MKPSHRKRVFREHEVREFAARWPGARLHDVQMVTVEFDRDGDLVDVRTVPVVAFDVVDPLVLACVAQDAKEELFGTREILRATAGTRLSG